jgi:lipopolysaccharide transport system ATP-binding protein
VVDEALSVGDEAFQRKCFARIEAIKERGGTILFVSHSAQTVVQLCDRAVLLDGGEKILEGRPKRVTLQYQRLVNASAEAAPEIRASIIAMGAESAGPEKELPDVAANPLRAEDLAETSSQEAGIVVPTTTNSVSNLGTFDPNLKSQSMVSTEERGARIHNARIVNLNGEEVNILQMERRYIFEFDVEFASHARQVSFGMAMRTQTGVILAGASSRLLPVRRIDSVAIGHVSRVQFEFTCLMLPGVYFLGCSVFGQTGEDFDLMHRIVDALAFRVAFEQDILAAGFFDISPQLTVKQL